MNPSILAFLLLALISFGARAGNPTYTELGPPLPAWVHVSPTFSDHQWTFEVDTNGHSIASFHVYDRGDLSGGGSYYGASPTWGPLQSSEYGSFYWQSYNNQNPVIDTTDRNHPYYVPWKFWVSSDQFTAQSQFYYSVDVASIPEPQTDALLLMGFGIVGMVIHRRKKKPAQASKPSR